MGNLKKSQTISATVIVLNEEKNIARCLKSLDFVDEIIVIDSNSNDQTVQIAKSFKASVIQEKWHGYGTQKNIAASHATKDWILNIDADEEITPALRQEILEKIADPKSADLYAIARKTFYMNQWVRHGGWYPNYVARLCRNGKAKWTEPLVHEELKSNSEALKLTHPMNHFTFSSITDQVQTNLKYAKQGSDQLYASGVRFKITPLIYKPIWKFIHSYFIKLGCLDGILGFIIAINAAHSMFLKYALLYKNDLHKDQKS